MDKRPKVYIACSYALVDTNASTERIRALVHTLKPHYDVQTVSPTNRALTGVPNVSLNTKIRKNSFISRAVTEIIFTFKVAVYLRGEVFRFLYITCPSMFLALLVPVFKDRTILDYRDITWDSMPQSFLYRRLKVLFDLLFRMCTQMTRFYVVTNKAQKMYLNKYFGTDLNDILVVYNGISFRRYSTFRHAKYSTDFSERPIRILYVGNVAPGRGVEHLMDAIGGNDDYQLDIVGEGSNLGIIREMVVEYDYSNIVVHGSKAWDELSYYYLAAHILYGQIGYKFRSAIPSKIYEYLSLSQPILFGGIGALEEFCRDFPSIKLIRPESVEEIRVALVDILKNPCLRTSEERRLLESRYIREHQFEVVLSSLNTNESKKMGRWLQSK